MCFFIKNDVFVQRFSSSWPFRLGESATFCHFCVAFSGSGWALVWVHGVILGLSLDYLGVILGLSWGYWMPNKMTNNRKRPHEERDLQGISNQ